MEDHFPYKQLISYGSELTWITRTGPFDRVINVHSEKILGASSLDRDQFLTESGANIGLPRIIQQPSLIQVKDWWFPTFSGWDSVLHKTMSAFNYALNHTNFDFIVRTAPSSFWNPRILRQKISELNIENCAYGTVRYHFNTPFIEGSNLILDRKTVETLVTNNHLLNYGIIDDVAIGRALGLLGVNMVDWPRPRIEFRKDFFDKRYGSFNQIYSFRCRRSKEYSVSVLVKELMAMRKLHRILLDYRDY